MKRTVLLTAVLIAGCAGQPATYSQGNATSAQFSRDKYECERDARMLPDTNNCQQLRFYESCMQSKGYLQKDKASFFC